MELLCLIFFICVVIDADVVLLVVAGLGRLRLFVVTVRHLVANTLGFVSLRHIIETCSNSLQSLSLNIVFAENSLRLGFFLKELEFVLFLLNLIHSQRVCAF